MILRARHVTQDLKDRRRHNDTLSLSNTTMKCSILSIIAVLIVAVSSANGFSLNTPKMALSGVAGGEQSFDVSR
jgi:hypothetical protein